MRILSTAILGACGLAFATPGQAVTTVLDFSGNICGPGGNQVCGDGTEIGQNYGDGVGVDVSHRSFTTATGVTAEPFLKTWNANYGDLVRVVWGGFGPTGQTSEITFAALAGYEMRILGFDGGCYLNRSTCRNFPFTISEIGGAQLAGGAITPPAGGHDTLTFGLGYSQSGYILRWGPDGYDGGLDNIAFDVRAIGAGAVPEPASWALLILGFGAIGGAMRRRSSGSGAAKARLSFA